MARDTKALEILRIEAGSAVVDGADMVHLGCAGPAFGTKGIRGQLPLAKLLPGAVIAPLGGRKLPGRLLAPWPGILVNAALLDHGWA